MHWRKAISQVNLSNLFFLFVIFFLPQQAGPHFWPDFSFVRGIRVDYLSPTFYISDLFILLLLFTSFSKVFHSIRVRAFLENKLFFLFLLLLIIPFTYAPSHLSLFYGIIKLSEFLYLGLYVISQVKTENINSLIDIFILNGVFESILAIAQFLKQSSIGTVLYFAGERTLNTATVGIATMSLNGEQVLRPYGTFPHPNVLAFFLFTATILGIYLLQTLKQSNMRVIYIISIFIIQTALLLTFSRVIILVNFLCLAYIFVFMPLAGRRKINTLTVTVVTIISIIFITYLSFFFGRFFNPDQLLNSVFPRLDLINISLQTIMSNPFFGVGLQQFFYFEGSYQTHFSAVYLQPVHNIYLYLTAQIGLVGLAIFLFFINNVFLSLWRKTKTKLKGLSFHQAVFLLLISLLFVGLFDHFFLTTQQGQLMFAVIIGLALTGSKSKK